MMPFLYHPLYVRSAFDDDFDDDDDDNNNKACGRSPLFFVRARARRRRGGERDSTQKGVCRTYTIFTKREKQERQKYLSFH